MSQWGYYQPVASGAGGTEPAVGSSSSSSTSQAWEQSTGRSSLSSSSTSEPLHTLLDMSHSESGDLEDDGSSAEGGHQQLDLGRAAATNARAHRLQQSDPEANLPSRAGSPLPPAVASASSSVSPQKSTSQLHIHHHYHHNNNNAAHHHPLRRPVSGSASHSARQTPSGSTESVPDFFANESYRSSRLAKKLGFADATAGKRRLKTASSSPHLSSWWTPPLSSSGRRSRRNSNIPLDAPPSYSLLADADASPSIWPAHFQKSFRRFLRLPFVPTQPLTILFTLVLVTSFVLSTTTFVIHALNNDKAPLPWRSYCQEQLPFPHDYADSLDPVNVFVGVFSFDAAYERRHIIRSTYMRQSSPGPNVQVKFILGRPRSNHARRIALEMETYNDIVVLDSKENMNKGKTYQFFQWAAENATVPVYWQDGQQFGVGFQQADYVAKADDDAFIVLSELERHLRVAPREMTYWGYLIRNLFMGGEAYALSQDLVQYIASYPPLAEISTGAEDKKVARWMRMHPNMTSINWVTERCWIYDHPKAQTIYSHGYLFPDQVERIRIEGARGLSPEEKARRGGQDWAQSWSSVSEWKKTYQPPSQGMSIEEEVEALVEGGGLWGPEDDWKAAPTPKDQYLNWDKLHFASDDKRLVNPVGAHRALPQSNEAEASRTNNSPAANRVHKIGNDLIRDVEEPIFPQKGNQAQVNPPRQHFAQLPDNLPAYERLVPPPTMRFDSTMMDLRNHRMLGRPYGGTVVVHFLKRHEWFFETSLALLGRHMTWDAGSLPFSTAALSHSGTQAPPLGDASADQAWNGRGKVKWLDTAAQWGTPRKYGSPIVRDNGYIAEGREGPFERAIKLPVDEPPTRSKGGGVWGRLRGKPKLRLADPGADEDGRGEAESDDDDEAESSASEQPSEGSDSVSVSEDVEDTSAESSMDVTRSLDEPDSEQPTTTQAAPHLVLQPNQQQ